MSGKNMRWIWAVFIAACFIMPVGMVMNSGVRETANNSGADVQGAGEGNSKVDSEIYLKAGIFDPLKNERPDVDKDLILTASRGYYLVQCKGPVLPEWQKMLENADARIISYIPEYAYLVYMDRETKDIVSQLDFVRWIGVWQPAYKIEPGLLEKTGTIKLLITVYDGKITMPRPIQTFDKNELKRLMETHPEEARNILKGSNLVVDVSGKIRGESISKSMLGEVNPNVKSVGSKIESMGGRIIGEADRNIADKNIIVAEIDASRIKDLAFLSQVHWIERYAEMVPYENYMAEASGMIAYTGETGNHPHIDGGFDGNQTDWSDTIRNIKGGDFEVYGIFEGPAVDHPAFEKTLRAEYIGDSNPTGWHATTTLGIAIASQEADSGDAMGQAPDAHWCTFSTSIADGAATMVSEGGVCTSSSWGPQTPEPAGDYGTYAKNTDDAATSGTGGNGKVLMFWSGGNDPQAPDSHAAAKDIMCIGGSDIKGTGARSDDTYASGACHGYVDDKRVKPDMVFNYIGEYIDVCNNSLPSKYEWNTGYVGTSYSSPAAAGVGTVYVDMWNANHFGNYPTALPSAACLKALMISDGYFMDLTKANRKEQGWGEVNAKRAYELGDAHYIFDQGVALNTGNTWSTTVNALDTSTFEAGLRGLRISLVWTDPSGDTAAAKALVNDLDLKVTGPEGTYYGNRGLDTSLWNALGAGTNYWSDAGGNYDDCNNVECVFIESPSPGSIYEITVTAASASAQKFALVVSGVVAGTGVPFWKDQTSFKMLNVQKTTVQVADSNLTGTPNSNTIIESIPASRVAIYSETDKTPLNITLTETAADSNVFENSSVVIYEADEGVSYIDYYGVPHLRASHGDTITIKYHDLAPTEQGLYSNATYDSFAPLIQCVWIKNIGRQQMSVIWYTHEDADTVIYMGRDDAHMFEVNESGDMYGVMYSGAEDMQPMGDVFQGYGTHHSVTIIGLNYSTEYQFQINATDKAGNKRVNDNNGKMFKFKTQVPQPQSILFVMDGIDADSSSSDYGIEYIDYYWTTYYLYKDNLAFDFWDHWDDGYPSIATLQPTYPSWAGSVYDLVIWDCSENNKSTLNATDRTDITNYLATADPNLWVIGSHVATDVKAIDATWLMNNLGAVWQTDNIRGASGWPQYSGEPGYIGFVNNTGKNIGGDWTQPAPADWEGYYVDDDNCMPIYAAGLIKDGMDAVKPDTGYLGEYQWEAVTIGAPAKPAMAVVSSGTTTKNMVFQIFTFESMFQDPFFWGAYDVDGLQPELWMFNVTNYLLGTDYGSPYHEGLYDAHYNHGHSNSEPYITGTVNDTQGIGVYGIVYAVNTTDPSIVHGGAYSYMSGEYNISGLTAGESYYIYAQSFESETVWVNFRTGFTPAYYGAPTNVAATASGIDIVLSSHTLSGYVTAAADGAPIEGATVKAYWYGTDYDVTQGSGTTNADGYYVITGFGNGIYDLVASKVGYYPKKIKNAGTTNTTDKQNKNFSLSAAPAAEVLFVNDDSWYGYGTYTYTRWIEDALNHLGIPYDYWFTGGDKTDVDGNPIPPSEYDGLPTASMMSAYKVVIWADGYMYYVAPGNDYAINASERTEIGNLLDGTSGTDFWLEGALIGYSASKESVAAQNWLCKYFLGDAAGKFGSLDDSAGTWSGISGAVKDGYIANGLSSNFYETYRCWYTVTPGANYQGSVNDNVNSKTIGFTGTYNVTNNVYVAFQSFYAALCWDEWAVLDTFIGNFFTFSNNSYLPSSPKNLQAKIVNDAGGVEGTRAVQLDWDASPTLGNPSADYYYIYRDTTPDFVPGAGNKIAEVVASDPVGTTETILTQDFSSGVPPTGWSKEVFGTTNWISSSTANAGGTSPEAKLKYGGTGDTGTARLYSNAIDTSAYDSLTLKWKNYLDNYDSATYPYTIKIETSSDAVNWHDTTWIHVNPSADIGPGQESFEITTVDAGSATFRFSFTLTGKSYGINAWWVDDAELIGYNAPVGPPAKTIYNDTSAAATDTNTYYYIVRAHNSKGTDQNFDRVCKSSISLVSGWNLISLPLMQSEAVDNITEQLISISGKYEKVQVYDALDTEDHWKMYIPGGKEVFNDLKSIGSQTAVWIKMTASGNLIYAGQEWGGRLMWLEPGWNFISYPTFKIGRTVSQVFDPYLTLGYTVETVASQGSNALTTLSGTSVMKPGWGYWVYIDPDKYYPGEYVVI